MPEFFSYSIQDFIPFNADAYMGIFVSQFEDYFPLHVAFVLAALFAVYALRSNKVLRVASALLVCVLVGFVGWDFFGGRYSVLNWAAPFFVWAFYGLGVLSGASIAAPPKPRSYAKIRNVSASIFIGSALLYPLLGVFSDKPASAEFVGLSPDPTCLFLLGISLIRGGAAYLPAGIALLWLAISSATLHTLELNRWILLAGLGVVFLVLATHLFLGDLKKHHASSVKD